MGAVGWVGTAALLFLGSCHRPHTVGWVTCSPCLCLVCALERSCAIAIALPRTSFDDTWAGSGSICAPSACITVHLQTQIPFLCFVCGRTEFCGRLWPRATAISTIVVLFTLSAPSRSSDASLFLHYASSVLDSCISAWIFLRGYVGLACPIVCDHDCMPHCVLQQCFSLACSLLLRTWWVSCRFLGAGVRLFVHYFCPACTRCLCAGLNGRVLTQGSWRLCFSISGASLEHSMDWMVNLAFGRSCCGGVLPHCFLGWFSGLSLPR